MYKIILGFILTFSLYAETNRTQESNVTVKKIVKDKNSTKRKLTEQQIKEQMAREAEYAKSQSFAQGDEYDLKAVEVNPDSLDTIPTIEPEYDFDMTDVYRDDL